MRRAFLRVGFIQEAHSRQGWPQQDDTMHNAVGYAVLRQDWETGTTTPVPRARARCPDGMQGGRVLVHGATVRHPPTAIPWAHAGG